MVQIQQWFRFSSGSDSAVIQIGQWFSMSNGSGNSVGHFDRSDRLTVDRSDSSAARARPERPVSPEIWSRLMEDANPPNA
jgi:hypothetical protein